MKKMFFVFVKMGLWLLILLPFTLSAQSEETVEKVPVSGPVHPLVNFGKPRLDTKIIKINYFDYYSFYIQREVDEPMLYSSKLTRSDDLLTDTLHNVAAPSFVFRYNEKNQLIAEHDFSKNHPFNEYVRTDYLYDEDGRMVKEIATAVQPYENPSIKPSEKFLKERIFDYSTVQKTEKGYIFEEIEYELDDQGRLACMIFLNFGEKPGEHYVKYIDGKDYRIDASYYSYTDSSYTEFGRYAMNFIIQGMPDFWIEQTIVYYPDGNVKSQTVLISEDGIDWVVRGKLLIEYEYASETQSVTDEPGTFNTAVGDSKTAVYAVGGAILISTENACTVQIFDLAGRIVKQQTLPSGENRITVNEPGLYVVRLGDQTFKVFVR